MSKVVVAKKDTKKFKKILDDFSDFMKNHSDLKTNKCLKQQK